MRVVVKLVRSGIEVIHRTLLCFWSRFRSVFRPIRIKGVQVGFVFRWRGGGIRLRFWFLYWGIGLQFGDNWPRCLILSAYFVDV